MSKTNNLDGKAPDKSEIAIVLIDVIKDLEFEEGEEFLKTLRQMQQVLKADIRPSTEIDFAVHNRRHASVATQR